MPAASAYLLDTHALIWWWLADPRLSPSARATMAKPDLPIRVSAVSGYEIGLKVRTGELAELAEPLAEFDEAVLREGFEHLALRHEHTVRAALMSGEFKDPFDRMIAAQALTDDMIVISRDRSISAFGCRTLW